MNSRPAKLVRDQVARALADANTNALTVLAVCMYTFPDYASMDPLEVYAGLKDEYGVDLPQALENKLQAITVALTSNLYETDPSVFDSVVKAIGSGDPDLDDGDDAELDEMLWADYEVRVARDEGDIVFAAPVQRYRDWIESEASEQDVLDVYDTLETQRAQLLHDMQSVGFEIEHVPEI